VTLLSAGTDGRDGTTDAAGAIVDAGSWKAMQEANAVPERALVLHEAHAALRAAGLLLETGPTGTNVMDVVIGLVGAPAAE
jgi:glycerate 2-kinase